MKSLLEKSLLAVGIGLASTMASAGAIHDTHLFSDNTLPHYDDNNSGSFATFPIDFFGTSALSLSVNSNGLMSLGNLWPINFNQMPQIAPVLAPFFANVDNRYGGTVQWGFDEIDGRRVLGAQWLDVMAYNHHPGKTNSFQMIITDRSDVAPGAFDFEFNYDRITWDTSDPAWWDADPAPDVARVGWFNNLTGELHEFAGSGVAGALLDDNPDTGLIHHSRNSDVLGRYSFQVRDGTLLPETPLPLPSGSVSEPMTLGLLLGGLGLMRLSLRRAV